MGVAKYHQDGDPRKSGPGFGLTMHEQALGVPGHWRDARTIFVDSMSDLFHPEVTDDFIRQVFEIMRGTPRHTYQVLTKRSRRLAQLGRTLDWPSNAWIGVSIETDEYTFRADHLRRIEPAVRFLSLEPLLGPLPSLRLEGIGWVIVGGESGTGYRPVEADWVREIRDRCVESGIPFFFKQWGGQTPKAGGRELDGRTWSEKPTVELPGALT